MAQSNKEIVRQVNAGFSSGDRDAIMQHIADNVRWEIMIAGNTTVVIGMENFRKEILSDGFTGLPIIKTANEIEEGNLLAVEGDVTAMKTDGSVFMARFFDFYRFDNGKIVEMRSYLNEIKPAS